MQASRILVPVTGNPTDDEVVELAASIARRQKAEVFALHVIEVKRTLPLDAELPDEAARGEEILNRAEAAAEKHGIHLQTDLLQARDVGHAIVDEALERGMDLIILGITYRKRFGEFDLGETAPYVLKHAPCRVWVCREPTSV
ncbi:MAG: universal stress protein [Chloroflexota bacterium]